MSFTDSNEKVSGKFSGAHYGPVSSVMAGITLKTLEPEWFLPEQNGLAAGAGAVSTAPWNPV